MAINSTILVTNVAPILHLHEYSVYHLAALYAVADKENQVLEQRLVDKGEPTDSHAWMGTWCRAGVHGLAFSRGISVSQMNKALAKAERDGLIEVRPNGSRPAWRRVNKTALRCLQPASKIEMRELFNDWKATAKTKEKFGLGALDWMDYLKPEHCDGDQLPAEKIASIRKSGPAVLTFRNVFDRDRFQMWVKKNLASDGFTSTAFTETEQNLTEKHGGVSGRAKKSKKKADAASLKLRSCLRISHPDSEDGHQPEPDNFDVERHHLSAMRNAAFGAAANAADVNREQNYLMTVGAEIPSWWASHREGCAGRSQEADARYEEARRHYIANGGDLLVAQGPTPGDVTAACIRIDDARAEYEAAEATYSQVEDDLRLHLSAIPTRGAEKVHAARTRSLEEKINAAEKRAAATVKVFEDAQCDAHLNIGCWVGERQGCARATARVLHSRREVAVDAVGAADGEAWEAEEEMGKNPTPVNKDKYERLRQVAAKAQDEFETVNIELTYLHPGEFCERMGNRKEF
jgi:hypothetical protein